MTSGRGRNRPADLLRVTAIGAVVVGHWLLTDVTYHDGRLSGRDALRYVGWAPWVTLVLQVMPVFFVVGGYANAVSWSARRQRGERGAAWVRVRVLGLLWPTAVYVVVAMGVVCVVAATGVAQRDELRQAGWFVALHLWFLPVYLVLIALTPALYALHLRWGLRFAALVAGVAVVVDVLVVGPGVPVVGGANYLLVWGAMYLWGFAWHDGSLTRPRARCAALGAGGVALLTALLVWGPFPVAMIGAGTRVENTSPPSVALLAFAAAQTGLLLTAEPALARLLTRPVLWRRVSRANTAVMTLYLWHMAPVIAVAVALYPAGIVPQPSIGSGAWLALRVGWVALLAVLLLPLVRVVLWAERPLRHLPPGIGTLRRRSPVLLAVGTAVAAGALARFAAVGFAPGGHPAWPVLLLFAGGLLLVLFSGRDAPPGSADR
ncbi:acyltransferase family protein [Streptomyces avicenniae]|uniref:acyltransferase family protein n=1 Tax=Streptomyces avicenniae TaxID=500153 RepID=UPI0006995573|nr:acyltransferase [Streptomyces avicenniae]